MAIKALRHCEEFAARSLKQSSNSDPNLSLRSLRDARDDGKKAFIAVLELC